MKNRVLRPLRKQSSVTFNAYITLLILKILPGDIAPQNLNNATHHFILIFIDFIEIFYLIIEMMSH